MKMVFGSLMLVFALMATAFGEEGNRPEPKEAEAVCVDPIPCHLQEISVTIKTGRGEGSGVIVTREVKAANGKTETINFVWTAAHVVEGLRSVRSAVDPKSGQSRQIVEF